MFGQVNMVVYIPVCLQAYLALSLFGFQKLRVYPNLPLRQYIERGVQ